MALNLGHVKSDVSCRVGAILCFVGPSEGLLTFENVTCLTSIGLSANLCSDSLKTTFELQTTCLFSESHSQYLNSSYDP